MKVKRKIAALFFALLVIFFSATYYSTSANMLEKHGYAGNIGIAFTSYAEQAANFFLQQKSFSSGYQGWKTEVGFPGVYCLYHYACKPFLHNEIRKIFVIDSQSYSPCKSIILFPFHEFL
jgi:hypothetical protein